MVAAAQLPYAIEPGGLSPELHERIFEMVERGWKARRIARELRKHPSTVQWFFYRHGIQAPKPRPHAKPYARNGVLVRPFGPDEDAFIQELRVEGHGPTRIAELANARFGNQRDYHRIRVRLVMLAARDDDAEAA